MKPGSRLFFRTLFFMLPAIAIAPCLQAQPMPPAATETLSEQLARYDSLFFKAALLTQDTRGVERFLTSDFEFYHDNGYAQHCSTETRAIFTGNLSKLWQKNKADGISMRRELVKASLQVFPAHGDQAVQLGVQRFFVSAGGQKEQLVETSKFSRLWQKQNGQWKMMRELDYLVNASPDPQAAATQSAPAHKTPVSPALYNEIAHMDSVLFDAYNAHDLEKIKTLFTEDLEFYHDLGGLTNYLQNMVAFKNNFDKNMGLHRELVPGTLEVYPVKDYGAMEIGAHRFCHKENGMDECGTFKFVMIWQKKDGQWKISRVVSYGH